MLETASSGNREAWKGDFSTELKKESQLVDCGKTFQPAMPCLCAYAGHNNYSGF